MTNIVSKYNKMVSDTLRTLIPQCLKQVAESGLEGDQHFMITFATGMEGVSISPELKTLYPEGLTIILQHEFEDLVADDEGFRVTLFFNGTPQDIYVPYTAVSTFSDPSEKFALFFEVQLPESDSGENPVKGEVVAPVAHNEDNVIDFSSYAKKDAMAE